MARVTLVAQEKSFKYPLLADLSVLTWTASDAVNFEQTVFSGKETILAWNTSADTAYNVTITSSASARTARTGTLVKSVAFGTILAVGPLGIDGWKQSDGKLYFAGENAAVLFAVVRLG